MEIASSRADSAGSYCSMGGWVLSWIGIEMRTKHIVAESI